MERDYGWSRGEESEDKVRQILEELREEGEIKDFGQSFRFYQEDSGGIDFFIITKDDKLIPLQVKSSFNQGDKEKYKERGIYYLGGVAEKTLDEIKKEILVIVKQKNKLRKSKIREKIEIFI
jgi:hypothetical protein